MLRGKGEIKKRGFPAWRPQLHMSLHELCRAERCRAISIMPSILMPRGCRHVLPSLLKVSLQVEGPGFGTFFLYAGHFITHSTSFLPI